MYLLLVDQNTIASFDLKEMIGRLPEGTEIVNCYTTDALIKLTGTLDPDLILVDFGMVDQDYNQLFQRIREKSGVAQIIAMIEPENYESLNQMIDAGVIDNYIVKPINKEDFMARLKIAAKRLASPGVYTDQATDQVIEEREFVGISSDDAEEKFNLDQEVNLDLDSDEEFEIAEGDGDQEQEVISASEDKITTAYNNEDNFEPYPVQNMVENDELSSDFFELEFIAEETAEQVELPDSPEIEEQQEAGEAFLEDPELFDESEKAGQDDHIAPPLKYPVNYAVTDNDSLDTPPAKSSFDNLFDDVGAAKPATPVDEDAGLFDPAAESPESISEPIDSWDFTDDEIILESKDHELNFNEMTEIKSPEEKSTVDSGFVPESLKIGEDYFEDLFSDSSKSMFDENQAETTAEKKLPEDDFDFFNDEPVEPARELDHSERKSHFPGESADDFLFGESDEANFDHLPESVKNVVTDKETVKGKLSVDDFSDDLFSDDEDNESKKKVSSPDKKKDGPGKFISTLGNIIFVCFLLMMAVLSFFLVQSRISGGAPQVAGYQLYIVLSGSMSPEFDTGSLAFVRETSPMEIVVGDIITFRSQAGSESLTTHRVVEVIREDGLKFITRGDANNVNDPNPVPAENVVGRVTGSVPYVGYLLDYVQTRQGLILLIFVPGVLIIIFELGKIVSYFRQGDGNANNRHKRKYSYPPEDYDL